MGMSLFAMLNLSAVCNLAFSLHYQFHFVSAPKTWTKALTSCQKKYNTLATINDALDMEEMTGLAGGENGFVGLRRRWGWSQSYTDDYKEGEEDYNNWPSGLRTGSCGSIGETGEWISKSCDIKLKFFCYNGSATEIAERFTLVNAAMKWPDARAHCRSLSTELARVRNQLENEELQKRVEGDSVWIGQTWTYWEWADRSQSSFIPWGEAMPLRGDQCAYLDTQNKPFKLKSTDCSEKMAFFCTSVQKRKQVVKLKLSADDLSVDSAVMDSIIKLVTEQLKASGLTEGVKVSGLRFAEEEITDKPKEPEQHLTHAKKICIR